jgi:hypothetical protein
VTVSFGLEDTQVMAPSLLKSRIHLACTLVGELINAIDITEKKYAILDASWRIPWLKTNQNVQEMYTSERDFFGENERDFSLYKNRDPGMHE